MDDLISRQALLDKFEPWLKVKDYNDGELNMLNAILYEIRFMRSAQPEPSQVARDIARIVENEQDMRILPKRGKWIRISKFPDRVEAYWVTCSACDMRIFGGGKFCPNCGADMRGEQYE